MIIKCKNSQTRIKYIYLRKTEVKPNSDIPRAIILKSQRKVISFMAFKRAKKVSIATLKYLKIQEIKDIKNITAAFTPAFFLCGKKGGIRGCARFQAEIKRNE